MTKAEVKKWREYAKAVKVYYGQLKDWIKGQPINAWMIPAASRPHHHQHRATIDKVLPDINRFGASLNGDVAAGKYRRAYLS
jgi:hypothetical protein